VNAPEHAWQALEGDVRLLEAAVHAVVVVDQAGVIVLVNTAAEAMFGYRRAELVGERAEILVAERSRRSWLELFTLSALTGIRIGVDGVDLHARREDGTVFPVEIRLSSLQADGEGLVAAAISDISERTRADAEIAQLAAIVRSSDDAMIGLRLDGTITSWNPAAERMYGYSAAEAVGRNDRMLCASGEGKRELERILERVVAGEAVDHFETRRRRRDGGVIDVSVTMSPIRNSRREVVGASAVARDVSERRRAADALAEAEARFRGAFEHAPIGMVMLTTHAGVLRINAAMCRLLGRDAEEIVGRSILEFTHAEDVQSARDWGQSISAGSLMAPLIKRYVRPDGSIVEAQVIAVLIEPPVGEPYLFSQAQDVTGQRRAERQKAAIADLGHRALEGGDVVALMSEAVRMVREMLATTLCIVSRVSTDGAVRLAAAAGESLSWTIGPGHATQAGYTLALGKPVVSDDLLGETRFSAPASVIERGMRRSLSVPVPDRSGARLVILAHGPASMPPFKIDDVRFVETVAHVIAGALDRAASEDELRRRALEDPLTGLANRALLSSELDAELRHARRLGNRVWVLVLDVDRFKTVNDTLGHNAGDGLLRLVAARLTTCVREEDLVARPGGGDEFTVVCARAATDHAITDLAERLVEAMVEPFELDGREVFLTASVGVTVSEHGAETPEELLRDADAAMHRAKERGGSRFEIFDIALRQHLIARMAIEGDLRHALERDQFELHYQPLIDLAAERVVGFEALLRWRHPERGLIAPDQFIPIAEDTGLIVAIGSWVLREVCTQLAQWPHELHVAANLSALQITPELVIEVERVLIQHLVAPSRLMLEITESLVLDPAVKPIVTNLRALGVQLALDDFGTGYSSLGSLQRFPLDVLKLDRTLTDSLTERSGVAVARAAVELGRALGVDVIAEGIETKTQLAILRELRCPLGQGYLFAKPLPLADAQKLITISEPPGRSCVAERWFEAEYVNGR
jgi:diguanylate cyclase (GGDEF)-like protein/PAS domain S-box-containing protein